MVHPTRNNDSPLSPTIPVMWRMQRL